MITNEWFHEANAVASVIEAQSVTAGTATTTVFVDMSKFQRVAFVLNLGATDGLVDMVLQEETDSSGSGAANLTGKAITQLTGGDDDSQAIVEVASEELTDDFTHVGCLLTIAGTSLVAVIGYGFDAFSEPASDNDLSSVAEIVT